MLVSHVQTQSCTRAISLFQPPWFWAMYVIFIFKHMKGSYIWDIEKFSTSSLSCQAQTTMEYQFQTPNESMSNCDLFTPDVLIVWYECSFLWWIILYFYQGILMCWRFFLKWKHDKLVIEHLLCMQKIPSSILSIFTTGWERTPIEWFSDCAMWHLWAPWWTHRCAMGCIQQPLPPSSPRHPHFGLYKISKKNHARS